MLHEASVRKLLGYDGRTIWHEQVQLPPKTQSLHISSCIDIQMRNVPAKSYKHHVTVLLGSAKDCMTKNGFDVGTSGIIANWTAPRRKRTGPVTVSFPSVPLARAFHYQYKGFEWESEEGTQTVIIELQHATFDAEMCDPRVRLAVATAKDISPDMLRSIVAGISN